MNDVPLKSNTKNLSLEAVQTSQEFVLRKLITPSTAKFQTPSQARVTKTSDNQYVITSYVDAQDLSGASIRKNYECIFKYEPENSRWSLVEMNFEK